MKKYYDVYVQCKRCDEECHHGFLTDEKPMIGKCIYRCERCAEEYEETTGLYYDEFVITDVGINETYCTHEDLIEWYRDLKSYNSELVDHHFDWDVERDENVPIEEIEVVSVTVFSTPPWMMPDREWFTLDELSDRERLELERYSSMGYVQLAGSTVLIHKEAAKDIFGNDFHPLKPSEMEKKYNVCVDLNGVLDIYDGWKGDDHVDPPRPGAKAFLEELAKRYRVIIFTTQPSRKVWNWLIRYELDRYVTKVTDRKPPALFYIDDRAVTFNGNFEGTLEKIKSFKPHWKVKA